MYFTDRGIEELEKRRGEEEVSLAWLAEQLRTFTDLNPEFEAAGGPAGHLAGAAGRRGGVTAEITATRRRLTGGGAGPELASAATCPRGNAIYRLLQRRDTS